MEASSYDFRVPLLLASTRQFQYGGTKQVVILLPGSLVLLISAGLPALYGPKSAQHRNLTAGIEITS